MLPKKIWRKSSIKCKRRPEGRRMISFCNLADESKYSIDYLSQKSRYFTFCWHKWPYNKDLCPIIFNGYRVSF